MWQTMALVLAIPHSVLIVALIGPSDVTRCKFWCLHAKMLALPYAFRSLLLACRSHTIYKPHFVAVQCSHNTCQPNVAAACRHGSIREPVVYNSGAVQLDGDVCLCTGMCAAAHAQQLCSALVRVCIRQAQYASTCSAIIMYHLCGIAVQQCRYPNAVKCEGYHGFANHLPFYSHGFCTQSHDMHQTTAGTNLFIITCNHPVGPVG